METPTRMGPLARFAKLGALPADTADEALRKEILVLSAGLITALAVVWVVTYWVLGLYLAAAIPFAYQVVSILNLVIFAKTKRYRFFRLCELGLSLLLPFFLQLSLGGFVPSSGVILWSFTAPLGALLFYGRREAVPWFVAFGVAVALAAALDPVLANKTPEIPRAINIVFFALNCVAVTGTCYVLLLYFVRERERYAAALAMEQERSERLLLNVLPEPIASRLKAGENLIADGVSDVGVLFADIAGFTPMAESMPPEDVVRLLNEIFSAFDRLAAEYRLEKIKTIGDAYMVASGLLEADPQHADNLARMALAMRKEMTTRDQDSRITLRIGIDIGPVVAGVIGRSKFIYDLWGDTVNTASRMESHGLPGAIHVTERAADRLAASFVVEDRGEIDIKGKGRMRTYLLIDERPATSSTPPRTNPSGSIAL
jgi:adenylate cyclase